jgi:hypothetical protein
MACGLFTCLGFGNLEHRLALNPGWAIFVYIGLLCPALLALVQAILIWNRDALLPYRRGVYAFPVSVVDARSAILQVHNLSDLAELKAEGSRVSMRFSDGTTFEFRNLDPSRIEEVKATIQDAQQRMSVPPSEESNRDHALLDPLMDTGFKSLFSPTESIRARVVAWAKVWPFIALALGVMVGAGLWELRNVLSAKHLYIKARTLNSTHAYRAYLARGGKRRDVADLLLPRAELRDVRAVGTVDAIEQFMDAHPKSRIESEVSAALYAALLDELEKVRSQGTLAALRSFRRGDPRALQVEPERAAAQKELFRIALARFQTESMGSPELKAFFERLLAYSEQQGPKVEIRFRRRLPESVTRSESQLQRSAYFGGSKALPAQYFNAKHSEPREAIVAAAISNRLATVFSRDILSFEPAGELVDDDSNVPALKVPTLLITHTTDMVPTYSDRKPRGAFVGLSLLFKAQLLMPGDPAPPTFQCSLLRPPDLKQFDERGWSPEQLYDSMAQETFAQFLKRYLATLFRAPE